MKQHLTRENLLKTVATIGIVALAVEIVRKNWTLNRATFANIRSTVPALLALAYATMKGIK